MDNLHTSQPNCFTCDEIRPDVGRLVNNGPLKSVQFYERQKTTGSCNDHRLFSSADPGELNTVASLSNVDISTQYV